MCVTPRSAAHNAVMGRSGKLIQQSLETDTIEVAKQKLRDFLGEHEHAASDAHKIYLDVHMKEFLAGRTGAPKTLKPYHQLTGHVCANWPIGAHQVLAKADHSQCSKWLSHWNGQVANRKTQRSPLAKRLVKAMRRPQVIRNAPAPQEFEAIL